MGYRAGRSVAFYPRLDLSPARAGSAALGEIVIKRAGYYVNGRHYYGLDKRAQALAKAHFLESEYGRKIQVEKVDYDSDSYVIQPREVAA